ncbi:uncharacterized protein LOC125046390 [Penaeus chinensis]|uniref:uncharacterized protein LOC125046390 n=1 Tax=Penaeus chinensis TaxID=139456 RepID=UPI001FB60E8E|nr:uncharacterized protein LOC125046390 [Penaeus chinensis]
MADMEGTARATAMEGMARAMAMVDTVKAMDMAGTARATATEDTVRAMVMVDTAKDMAEATGTEGMAKVTAEVMGMVVTEATDTEVTVTINSREQLRYVNK